MQAVVFSIYSNFILHFTGEHELLTDIKQHLRCFKFTSQAAAFQKGLLWLLKCRIWGGEAEWRNFTSHGKNYWAFKTCNRQAIKTSFIRPERTI